MAQPASNMGISGKTQIEKKKLLSILCTIFLLIAGMAIFQDYLEARRVDRSFYFSESFLFKTIWLLFIPMLMILYNQLKKQDLSSPSTTASFILIPVIVHYLILPFVFLFFSVLFYDGRYGLYKILTYTLANDLYKLVIVYSTFVLGYKFYSTPVSEKAIPEGKEHPEELVINNGKNNIVVRIPEIVQIIAATPYVTLQLNDRKYLHSASLKSISSQLDPAVFLRVHKSTIVNKNNVVSFKSRLNGDYDLLLTNGELTRLSRTYAADFRKRFEATNRVTS